MFQSIRLSINCVANSWRNFLYKYLLNQSILQSVDHSVNLSFNQSFNHLTNFSHYIAHCLPFSFVPSLAFPAFFFLAFYRRLSSHNQLLRNVTLFYLLSASVSLYFSLHFFFIFRNIFE